MAIRLYRAYSPGTRSRSSLFFDDISTNKPEKSLTYGKKRCGGRNNRGIITLRGRGGGHKKKYRLIEFRRRETTSVAKVVSIEYDPNRSARIALLHYQDGEKRYILSPRGLKVGESVLSDNAAPIKIGNSLPLMNIPLGTEVHNIELETGRGGQLARAAGSLAQIVAKEGKYVTLRLPSGEVRLITRTCWATIGQVGNHEASTIVVGKAGRKRWLGRRPKVRGVVKNPVDHPHGGGEGRSPIGRSRPVTPWGKPALGIKTRVRKKYSTNLILRGRK